MPSLRIEPTCNWLGRPNFGIFFMSSLPSNYDDSKGWEGYCDTIDLPACLRKQLYKSFALEKQQ